MKVTSLTRGDYFSSGLSRGSLMISVGRTPAPRGAVFANVSPSQVRLDAVGLQEDLDAVEVAALDGPCEGPAGVGLLCGQPEGSSLLIEPSRH